MNEQLQSKLVEILDAIQQATRATGDFLLEQLPDIAQQYIMYGRVSSLMWVAFWIIAALASAYACRHCWRKEHEQSNTDKTGSWGFGAVLSGAAAFGTGLGVVNCAQDALLVWLAPKVWLIKALAEMAK